MTKRLIVVAGPTAVGKTAFAIRLARQFETEVVSCDSRQFYKELDIGVARPSPAELNAVRHHFIADRPVSQPLNVYTFEQEAMGRLASLFASHDVVVAVGGSWLYVQALCCGVSLLPDPAPELRASLHRLLQDEGIAALQQRLLQLDPTGYEQIDRQNPARLQRAIEISVTCGRPYSEVIHQAPRPRPFAIEKWALDCDRALLRRRIDDRVDDMMHRGLLDEAQSLLPLRDLNTLNTVGYKELFAYFDGKLSLEEAVVRIKLDTWHYAKKQLTWLRKQPDLRWVDAGQA